jgi:tetratricopeptide (TPR) repeat protein
LANDSLDFVQRGKVSIVRRQYADAVKICRLGLLAHPTLVEGRLVLGMALSALERWDEVLAEMRVALELDAASALGWLLKGEALVGKGDYVQAEQALRRAKQLDPSNQKADQLLAEIQVARAAGFEGIPAEPTDTKVYPARATVAAAATTDPGLRRRVADPPVAMADAEDEATEVDPHPSGAILLGAAPVVMMPEPRKPRRRSMTPTPTPQPQAPPPPRLDADADSDEEELSTDRFVHPRGGHDTSYEAPADEDYGEQARPAVSMITDPGTGFGVKTPIELKRGPRLQSLADGNGRARAPLESSGVAIELSGSDLILTDEEGGVRVGGAAAFDLSDSAVVDDDEETELSEAEPFSAVPAARGFAPEEDDDYYTDDAPSADEELTRERASSRDDVERGTRPDAPAGIIGRARAVRPFDPLPAGGAAAEKNGHNGEARLRGALRPPASEFASTGWTGEGSGETTGDDWRHEREPTLARDGWQESPTVTPSPASTEATRTGGAEPTYVRDEAQRGAAPSRVRPRRVPSEQHQVNGTHGFARLENAALPLPARPPDEGILARARRLFFGDRPISWAVLATALVAVVAGGVVAGLVIRELRMVSRVAKRHTLAREKLAGGTYRGLQAAEVLFRQILTERDDTVARALRARTLAQLAYEFGDSPEPARRAVANLGGIVRPEAEEARIYLALLAGQVNEAAERARALRQKVGGAAATYLLARVELERDHAEAAADLLRAALVEAPDDVLALHALGLAEAAAGRTDRAYEAYHRALAIDATHVASLVDRALLQVRRGGPTDRAEARKALETVVARLAGEASPAQLARTYLGLAELELARVQGPRPDLAATEAQAQLQTARQALAAAVARRGDSDSQLSDDLAAAFLRALDDEAAEREARRALAGAGALRLRPRLTLAEIALVRGKAAEAIALTEGVWSQRPEALVVRSRARLALGQRAEARVDAESAVRMRPDLVAARVQLARVDAADGRVERALRELERLERPSATLERRADVSTALAEIYATRTPDRARLHVNEAMLRDPLSLDARLLSAKLLHTAGKLPEAKAELQQLLSMQPKHGAARRELAAVALEAGDAATARAELDRLAAEAPDVGVFIGAARASLALGDVSGADQRLQRALQLGPTGALAEEVQVLRARTLFHERRVDEAASILDALAASAEKGETAGLLMLAYLELGQPDRAASVPYKIPAKLRNAPEVLVARARLAADRNRATLAETLARTAIERLDRDARDPKQKAAPPWVKAEALSVLGSALWDQGSYKPALKALRSAVELDPRNARAFYRLGLTLDELRRTDEAEQALESAIQLDPKLADAHYDLGRVRQKSGDPRAADAFKAYLSLAPNGPFAADARAALNKR